MQKLKIKSQNCCLISIILIIISFFDCSGAQLNFDPLTIGVGARALGMGRAYAAVAEDADAIFNNPAGLGEIDQFKFTSMSGTVLEDVNYTVLGGIYPLGNKTSVGLGFTGAYVPGIEMRNRGGALLGLANYGNSVVIASLGRKLSDTFSVGLNFKYYLIDGSENDNGDGRGVNLDLGILQKGWHWLSLAVVGENLLDSSKMNFQNGQSENLTSRLRVGTRMYLLGSGFGAALLSPNELSLALDGTVNLREVRSAALSAGLEYSPNNTLTLRCGSDQGTLTTGLTFRLAGIGFHYAYHPFGGYTGDACNFFSLTVDERGWPAEQPADVFLGALAKPPLL